MSSIRGNVEYGPSFPYLSWPDTGGRGETGCLLHRGRFCSWVLEQRFLGVKRWFVVCHGALSGPSFSGLEKHQVAPGLATKWVSWSGAHPSLGSMFAFHAIQPTLQMPCPTKPENGMQDVFLFSGVNCLIHACRNLPDAPLSCQHEIHVIWFPSLPVMSVMSKLKETVCWRHPPFGASDCHLKNGPHRVLWGWLDMSSGSKLLQF